MAEQYSWLDASDKGYSAGQYGGEAGKLMKWSRNTVADGKWLNKETIEPFSGRDQYLLDSLNQTYDECSAFSGDLQNQITIIEARSDVIDVVGNHADFEELSAAVEAGTYNISDRDVIKVLNDECEEFEASGCQSYYRYLSATTTEPEHWEYVGKLEPYYNNASFAENTFNLANTDSRRNYTIKTDPNRFIQMSADGNTGTIGLTDEFISSASQVYNALSSISGINEGTIEGARVNHTVSNYSLAQGSACSASYDSFAQGRRNYANGQSIAAGIDNYAKSKSQALGISNSAYSTGFVAGSNNSAIIASFAQGSTNYAYNSSFAQGTSNSALTQSFAQGKDNSADYDAFAQGLSAFANNESLAQGSEVTAKSKSFAQGSEAYADSNSFAQGNTATATNASLAQGSEVSASKYSIAQGYKTSANTYSFAQGYNVTAGKPIGCALAQGNDVYVEQNSFGQGSYINSTVNSFAQGVHCSANNGAFAQGINNSATGLSQTLGEGLRASNGMAIGKYNKTTDARFVIGNGIDNDNRSDLYWINNTGDVYTNGNVSAKNFYINGNPIDSIVSAKFSAYNGSNTLLTAYPISSFGLYANTAKYITISTANNNRLDFSVADTLINSASSGYQAKQWINTNGDGIIGVSSTLYNNSANWQNTYSAVSSHSATWGETAYVPLSAIECKIGNANSAEEISFAQGQGASAETISFAQGFGSVAQRYSFAQGLTNSSTVCSFTQGISNIANDYSIAQGISSVALNYSQAFGAGTVITNTGMAIGNFNKTSADVAFVIGNGTNNANRSDLYWIDHDGNISAKGNISATNFYINGASLNGTHTYTSGMYPNQDSYDIVKMNINDISAVQTIQQMQRTVQTLCLLVSANNTYKKYALWPEEFFENTAASHSDMYIPVFDVKSTSINKTYIKTSDLNLGNYVSAAASQSITFQSAATIPSTLTNGVYYII